VIKLFFRVQRQQPGPIALQRPKEVYVYSRDYIKSSGQATTIATQRNTFRVVGTENTESSPHYVRITSCRLMSLMADHLWLHSYPLQGSHCMFVAIHQPQDRLRLHPHPLQGSHCMFLAIHQPQRNMDFQHLSIGIGHHHSIFKLT
jgi:hypothetical protein